mmetsp:Transcript_250/g.842  ORF Transcript_250/g.842 Transcript_250/m.842 type:complete len:268 (-) Transcript_250:150-953(-)
MKRHLLLVHSCQRAELLILRISKEDIVQTDAEALLRGPVHRTSFLVECDREGAVGWQENRPTEVLKQELKAERLSVVVAVIILVVTAAVAAATAIATAARLTCASPRLLYAGRWLIRAFPAQFLVVALGQLHSGQTTSQRLLLGVLRCAAARLALAEVHSTKAGLIWVLAVTVSVLVLVLALVVVVVAVALALSMVVAVTMTTASAVAAGLLREALILLALRREELGQLHINLVVLRTSRRRRPVLYPSEIHGLRHRLPSTAHLRSH